MSKKRRTFDLRRGDVVDHKTVNDAVLALMVLVYRQGGSVVLKLEEAQQVKKLKLSLNFINDTVQINLIPNPVEHEV